MKFTDKQRTAADNAYEDFRFRCANLGTDWNRHNGVAAFMIAKALMKSTLGLKYHQAEKWALGYLAELP